MAINRAKMSREEVGRRGAEAKTCRCVARNVYRQQRREGSTFLCEHPGTARAWADDHIQGMLGGPAVG